MQEEAVALPGNPGDPQKGTARRVSSRRLGRLADSDNRYRSQSLSLLWPGDDDPERSSACLYDRLGSQHCPIFWTSSMRFNMREEFIALACPSKEKEYPFSERRHSDLFPLSKIPAMIQKRFHISSPDPIQSLKGSYHGTLKVAAETKPLD